MRSVWDLSTRTLESTVQLAKKKYDAIYFVHTRLSTRYDSDNDIRSYRNLFLLLNKFVFFYHHSKCNAFNLICRLGSFAMLLCVYVCVTANDSFTIICFPFSGIQPAHFNRK